MREFLKNIYIMLKNAVMFFVYYFFKIGNAFQSCVLWAMFLIPMLFIFAVGVYLMLWAAKGLFEIVISKLF